VYVRDRAQLAEVTRQGRSDVRQRKAAAAVHTAASAADR
jgi:hypothetical protein